MCLNPLQKRVRLSRDPISFFPLARSRFTSGACILAAFTATTSFSTNVGARSLNEIQATKELRACVSYNSPYQGKVDPPGCRDNCVATGDVADLVDAFAKDLGSGITGKVISIGWNEQFEDTNGTVNREAAYTPRLLADKTCDLYATGLAKTAWRKNKMAMVTINPSRNMVVVKTAHKNSFRTPADLAGRTAATYKDTSYHTWLDEQNRTAYKANPITIVFVADESEALAAVDSGKADFTVLVADDAVPETRKEANRFALAFPAGPVIEMSWAFRLEDQDLQAAANRFLQSQRDDKNSLLNKQFNNLYGMGVSEFTSMVSDIK